MMKGIVLAGGTGSRLLPSTNSTNKHLLTVYDKPMIYYPLSVLMLGGIRDILIISRQEDQQRFKDLLGDGSSFGLRLQYAVQDEPNGIPEALTIGEAFIGHSDVTLILADNIFFGQGFTNVIRQAIHENKYATIFGYRVKDPNRFGVIEFDEEQNVISLEEKPEDPKSDFAATGLYIYDHQAVKLVKKLSFSKRGELEITDLNKLHLEKGQLKVQLLGRGFAWMDAGTHDALFEASAFIKNIQDRQGFKVACLEEIAYYLGYISKQELYEVGKSMGNNEYGTYLLELAERKYTQQYWDESLHYPHLRTVKHG